MQNRPDNTELEAKFDINEADSERLKTLLSDRFGVQRARLDLCNIYFDTADLTLRNSKVALRIRSTMELSSNEPPDLIDWEQTVKAGGSASAGIHSRLEWNCPLGQTRTRSERPAMNLDWLAELFAVEAALPDGPPLGRLVIQFETNFERDVWLVVEADGTTVEIAFDRGSVLSDSGSMPLCELEIELKAGDAKGLDRFVASLRASLQAIEDPVELTASSISKAARGFLLIAQNSD